jgi:molybdenum cofactor biosynthesis enzyme MoaA
MNIQTLSIICGGSACNARCPFCVSRMTRAIEKQAPTVNWRNFRIACKAAKQANVSTAMLTGKGEPTLWPELVEQYLSQLSDFPFIELQTNGLAISRGIITPDQLQEWYFLGLTTIGISVVHWENEKNQEIYTPGQQYPDLSRLIDQLHSIGFSVRLCCVMVRGYVDDYESVDELAEFARIREVEQVTLTPVNVPGEASDEEAYEWAKGRMIDRDAIHSALERWGTKVMVLTHGGLVYDLDGQNICLNNCLSPEPTKQDSIRNLIFFPDGHLRYCWDHDGAIIL